MAELELIFQAITPHNHADALRALLAINKPDVMIASVGFVRTAGVRSIEAALVHIAPKSKFYVGIRNDITSIQAIRKLLTLGIEVYAVDTGSRTTIFHPKLYLAANASQALTIIGSANLTFNGLHNNIEVSSLISLDLSNAKDKKFVDSTVAVFSKLVRDHPKHVFRIKTETHAEKLFAEGRLADEAIVTAPSTSSSVKKGERDDLGPMALKKTYPPKSKSTAVPVALIPKISTTKSAAKPKITTGPIFGYYRVWQSKPLSERDLNIPKGTNTNPTGSMGWKKGLYDHIDQRQHFRDEVFVGLAWTKDLPPSRIERAVARFELVIKYINYGIFELSISHNFDTTTKSYIQGNMMTSLHWGAAKQYVAKPDLLKRTLSLYRKDVVPPEYLIEID